MDRLHRLVRDPGALSYIALTEQSISLGGRGGLSHHKGKSAIVMGPLLLGGALAPVWLLLRVHPLRRLLRLLLCVGWLAGSVVYLGFFCG